MSPASEVVGRESELSCVGGFVEAIPAGPSALILVGEAGIGKTTLWREGVAAATERRFRALSCRPVEAEIELPFAALGDLLEDVSDDVLAGLPDPQREALEIALLRAETKPARSEGRAVALGLLGVMRMVSEGSPLLLAIDDVQWLDAPSADALAFAARRLRGEPVGFLLARRGETPEGVPLGLDRALEPRRLVRLEVGPLDLQSLDRLLRTRLDRQFLRPALAEVGRVSGGNPFFALELGRAVVASDVPLAPGEPLPVPATLQGLVRERLAALPTEASEAALVVSALSRPTLELMAAVSGEGILADLDTALAAGIVEVAGDRIRFSHPLLASIVYAEAPPLKRRRLHARLAEIIDDPDERARHLALAATGPDPQVAAAVEDAARRARARGAPQTAAELWERARTLTPPGDAEGPKRAVAAAECHIEAGDTDRARVLLEGVVERLPPGPERGAALTRLAWVRSFGGGVRVGADLFRAALAESGDDPASRVEIELGLAWEIHRAGDVAGAEPHARAALELAKQVGDPTLLASALADMAFFETVLGRGIPTELIERALALDVEDDWRPFLGRVRPLWIQGMLLEWAGDLEASRATLAALRQSVIAQGDEHSVSYIAFHLARVECLAGNYDSAARHADECFEMTAQIAQEDERPFALAAKALVAAHRGDIGEARAVTDEGLPLALEVDVLPAHFEMLAIRGFLEHSLGDAAEAHRFLGPLPRAVAEAGFAEPALFRFHGDAFETLLTLGEPEAGEALLAELEEQARATGRVWAQTIASRCRALLSAARGDLDAALAYIARTLQLHDQLQEPLERGRTLVVLGALLRRSRKKRDARESLNNALNVFDALGAPLWSEKARAELGRVGGRAPAPGALTPTEERIAALVAAGHTYREVADTLFISPKTVQWNLSKIYRKLGVRSRAELAAKLSTAAHAEQTPAEWPVPR
jgi:DNA-binding CsgD family transcriptional regulator